MYKFVVGKLVTQLRADYAAMHAYTSFQIFHIWGAHLDLNHNVQGVFPRSGRQEVGTLATLLLSERRHITSLEASAHKH